MHCVPYRAGIPSVQEMLRRRRPHHIPAEAGALHEREDGEGREPGGHSSSLGEPDQPTSNSSHNSGREYQCWLGVEAVQITCRKPRIFYLKDICYKCVNPLKPVFLGYKQGRGSVGEGELGWAYGNCPQRSIFYASNVNIKLFLFFTPRVDVYIT